MNYERQWTDEELARDWIQRYSSARRHVVSLGKVDEQIAASRQLDAETEWAVDVFHELESKDPEHTWSLILLILRLAPGDKGVRDGLARRSPEFKDLLDGVWKRGMSDHLWERVQRAIGE